jgi:hypothetical protein
MLGNAQYEEAGCRPGCCGDRPKYGRTAQRMRERREWRRVAQSDTESPQESERHPKG